MARRARRNFGEGASVESRPAVGCCHSVAGEADPGGKKFRIGDLEGLSCYIKTKQSPNPEDPEDIFCRVSGVSGEPFRRSGKGTSQ